MKMISKVLLTAAAIAALAAPAMAADKLIVKNAAGTADVFKVDDAGSITAPGMKFDAATMRLGLGTTNPQATFHNQEVTGTNTQRGGVFTQINDGNQAAQILFQKSFGTEAVTTFPSNVTYPNPYIGIFTAQYWNGLAYDRSAQFGFRSDAPATQPIGSPVTTPGYFPTAILFQTGDRATTLKEGLRISSGQSVVAGNAGGTATADMTTTATDGFLFIPNVAGALTTCATAKTFTGHTPIWYDTTNNKICTCRASVLKCTAALL